MSIYDLTDLDLDNVPVLEPVSAGEHKVRITQVFTGNDKNGNDYWRFRLEVVGNATASDFGYFIGLPMKGMEAKDFDKKRRSLNYFLQAFNVTPSAGFDPENELVGAEGWAILDVKDEGEYGLQNNVKKWVTGK